MRKSVVVLLLAITASCLVPMAFAQRSELNNAFPRHFPTRQRFVVEFATRGGGSNVSYHGGPVLVGAYVVPIFWGPTWSSGGSDNTMSSSLTNFIDGGIILGGARLLAQPHECGAHQALEFGIFLVN